MLVDFFYFLLGISFGSFLNVVIYRLPNSLSIAFPSSHCIKCKKKIPFYLNIPILSYIILLGKCKFCKNSISIQYPLIESIIGFIFLYSFNTMETSDTFFFILIASLLICIAVIDFYYYLIPLQLSFILFVIVMINILISSNYFYYFYGMMIGFSYLLIIFIFTWLATKKQPLGYGDLILIIILGLWLGPFKILITIFLSAALGLIYWSIITSLKGYEKNRKLPYGTFLALTSIIIYCIQINWDLFRYI